MIWKKVTKRSATPVPHCFTILCVEIWYNTFTTPDNIKHTGSTMSRTSLAQIADEVGDSGSDYSSDDQDDFDLSDDEVSVGKAANRLMQSSPARMRSSAKKKNKENDFSMSIEDAAAVLRKSSDQSLFGRLFTQTTVNKKTSSKKQTRRDAQKRMDRINNMTRGLRPDHDDKKTTKKKKLKYATEEERIAMEFAEKKKAKARRKKERASRDDSRGGESKEAESGDFMSRMELKEKKRREKLERARGEKEYAVLIDKKCCPNCGAVQSYDEVVSRRNRCKKGGCKNALYRKPGMKDDNVFLNRLEKMKKDTVRKQKALEKKHTPTFRPANRVMFDPEEGKVVTLPYQERAGDWDGFMARMKEAEEKRKQRMLSGGANEAPITTKSAMF